MDNRSYRPSRPLMLVSIVLAILLGCLALVFLVSLFVTLFRGDFGDAAFAGFDLVAVGAFVVLMWRQSRLEVVVQDTGLHVVNYLSTFRVPWDSIERFDSSFGYWGIRVMMKDGRSVTLNAIQKWNIAAWLNRLTRADKIANELNERLARRGGIPRPTVPTCDHAL
jgi:Bacterial PH domain